MVLNEVIAPLHVFIEFSKEVVVIGDELLDFIHVKINRVELVPVQQR